MRKIKAYISLVLIITVILSCLVTTYAENSDKLTMELKIGSNVAKAFGNTYKIEKPYLEGNTIMIPLGWFASIIGAEVNWTKDQKIRMIYCDTTTELQIGKTSYTSGSQAKKLTDAPVLKNNRAMVPLQFLSENFPVTVSQNKKSGEIHITLEDDGALSDLSFLTGGITSAAVGNSFYGWSVNIPTGSRIIANSSKSDMVGITNESRSLYFEISVEEKKEQSLSEVYKDLLYSSNVRSSSLKTDAAIPYFEYTRLSEYDEALRVKVFDKGKYFYYFTINCYDNTVTPEKLMTDKYFTNIVNSFSLSYKGNVKGVEDISKIHEGKYSFYDYVMFNEDTKYLPWAMEVPAEWNQLQISDDPLTAELGQDSKHYMKIVLNMLEDGLTLEDHVVKMQEKYEHYFNPEKYSFVSTDETTIAGNPAYELKFDITQGNQKYRYDEYYFEKNGFVYEITIKLPESEASKGLKEFLTALNNMTFYAIDQNLFMDDLEKYQSKNMGIRVSNDDELFEYVNSDYGWSMEIPGYWTKSGYGSYSVTFSNPNTNANIMVDSVTINEFTKNLSDVEKFDLMAMVEMKYKVEPVKTQSVTENGYTVRVYTYTIEDADSELYAKVTFTCFDNIKYSYCYTTVVPDLTDTEEAKKEMDELWKSFKLIQK